MELFPSVLKIAGGTNAGIVTASKTSRRHNFKLIMNSKTIIRFFAVAGVLLGFGPAAIADHTPQAVPLVQKWTEPSLVTLDNDWSSAPGFMGYRGDKTTSKTGANPQTIVLDGTITTSVSVFANQSKPNSFRSGGVAEFDGIGDGVVAIKGSASASAPFLLLNLNTSGKKNIGVGYKLRDLDSSVNNAVQPVAFQYRVGTNSNFIDIPAAYIADATTGPNLATEVTPVVILLPAEAWGQPHVQVRWITCNAEGNDEWVGIDDIAVVADDVTPAPATASTATPGDSKPPVQPARSPKDAGSR